MNGFPLVATLRMLGGGGVLWANVAVLVVTTVALEATLLSPAMRRHVGHRRRIATPVN